MDEYTVSVMILDMILNKKSRDIKRTRKIFSILKLPTEGKVLDVSCGGGRLLKTIENSFSNLELSGVDITPGYLALNPELSKINFQTAEATSLPFADNYFNVTICAMSMHHYKDIASALTEIARVTKPGGQIYLIDFITKYFWTQFLLNLIGCYEPYHFEKFYREDELIWFCEAADLHHVTKINISLLPKIQALQFTK